MILILGECKGNYRATMRLYRERYPDRWHSTHMVNGTLTGAMYNDFLQNTLPQLLEDVDFATRQRLCNKTAPLFIKLVICEYFALVGSEGTL